MTAHRLTGPLVPAASAALALAVGYAVAAGAAGIAAGAVLGTAALLLLWSRPRLALPVCLVAAPFAAHLSTGELGGVTALAVVAAAGAFPTWGRVQHLLGRAAPLVAALVVAWLASGLVNESLELARPYLTRLVALPLLVAGLAAAVAVRDPGLRRAAALPVWVTAVAGTVAAQVLGDGERAGAFGDYGGWSTYLVLAAAACVPLARGSSLRLALLLAPVLAGLVATQTRSSFVAAVAAVALAAGWLERRSTRPGGAPRLRRLPVLAAVALAVAGVLLTPAAAGLLERLHGADVGTARSTENRVRLAETALRVGAEAPVLGIGPGAFSTRFEELRRDVGGPLVLDAAGTNVQTHSFYLAVLAETGMPSLAVVLALLAAGLRLRLEPEAAWLRGALAGLLGAGLVQNVELHLAFPLALGLLVGAAAAARGRPGRPSEEAA